MTDEIDPLIDNAGPRRPPPLEAVFPDRRHCAIGEAAERGDVATIRWIVTMSQRDLADPVDLDAASPSGANLLMYEITAHNELAIRTLIEAGADPNHVTPGGDSPMLAAAFMADLRGLRLLLDLGGDPNLCDARGEPLLIKVIYASRWKSVDLLIESGADIDALDPSGQTSVFLLANLGQWDQVLRFLNRGADSEVADDTRRTLRDVVAETKLPPESPQHSAYASVVARLGVR